MKTRTTNALAGLALLLASSGCDTVMSSEVPTQDIGLFSQARVGPDGRVALITQLTTDNPALLEQTYLDLDWDDALYAHLEGETVPMRREWVPVLNLVQYRAEFALGQPGDELSIELDRSIELSASDSYVTLPGSFTVQAPEEFSREEALTVQWTPAPAQESHFALRGSCLREVDYSFDANPGAVTVPALNLEKAENSSEDSCDVTLKIELSNHGVVDPAFGRGGSITAIQERIETLHSLP